MRDHGSRSSRKGGGSGKGTGDRKHGSLDQKVRLQGACFDIALCGTAQAVLTGAHKKCHRQWSMCTGHTHTHAHTQMQFRGKRTGLSGT